MSTTTDEQAPMTDTQLLSLVHAVTDQEYAGGRTAQIDKQTFADLVNEVLRLRAERIEDGHRLAWLESAMEEETPSGSKEKLTRVIGATRAGAKLLIVIDYFRAKEKSQ